MIASIKQLKVKKEKTFVVELLQVNQSNKECFLVVYYNRVKKNKESFEYKDLNIAQNFFNQLAS